MGLKVAVDKREKKVIMETNAKEVLQCLTGVKKRMDESQTVIEACWKEMQTFKSIKDKHIYREQNKVTNTIGYLMRELNVGSIMFWEPPLSVVEALLEDIHGHPQKEGVG